MRVILKSGEAADVPLSLVSKWNLSAGIAITPRQWEELVAAGERTRCRTAAQQMLAIREHGQRELAAKLRRKQFTAELVEDVVNELASAGLVDDARFAYALAQRQVARRPSSPRQIEAAIVAKGVTSFVAADAVDALLSDDNVSEGELAWRALQKRRRRLAGLTVEAARKAAYSYLAQRGFTATVAAETFERLLVEPDFAPQTEASND